MAIAYRNGGNDDSATDFRVSHFHPENTFEDSQLLDGMVDPIPPKIYLAFKLEQSPNCASTLRAGG